MPKKKEPKIKQRTRRWIEQGHDDYLEEEEEEILPLDPESIGYERERSRKIEKHIRGF